MINLFYYTNPFSHFLLLMTHCPFFISYKPINLNAFLLKLEISGYLSLLSDSKDPFHSTLNKDHKIRRNVISRYFMRTSIRIDNWTVWKYVKPHNMDNQHLLKLVAYDKNAPSFCLVFQGKLKSRFVIIPCFELTRHQIFK